MVCVGIYIFLQSFIDGPKIYFECIRRENATTILVLQLPLEKIYSDFFFKKKVSTFQMESCAQTLFKKVFLAFNWTWTW